MTPQQLADRLKALEDDTAATKARITKVMLRFQSGTEEHRAMGDADARISDLMQRVRVLVQGITPYIDPDFYAELKPSKALEDQGQFARDKLEQAMPQ